MMTCKENVATAITCGLEIWIKFTETSSALGGIFAVLYVQSSETFCGSWTRTSVSSREVLFDTADLDSPHSSHAPLQGHFKGVGGAGLFCRRQVHLQTGSNQHDRFRGLKGLGLTLAVTV